ncbi:hypothetical protein [Methylomagnum sp.]
MINYVRPEGTIFIMVISGMGEADDCELARSMKSRKLPVEMSEVKDYFEGIIDPGLCWITGCGFGRVSE